VHTWCRAGVRAGPGPAFTSRTQRWARGADDGRGSLNLPRDDAAATPDDGASTPGKDVGMITAPLIAVMRRVGSTPKGSTGSTAREKNRQMEIAASRGVAVGWGRRKKEAVKGSRPFSVKKAVKKAVKGRKRP
jgi:hypothetical protein